jgi:uncharacterized repeat protein (TIGR01451 family)
MRIKILLLSLVAAFVAMTGSASAAKVGNPGPISFVFESGEMKLGETIADAASEDDPITASGTVLADGTLRFTGLAFPDIEVENTAGVGPNPIIVHVLPQQIPGQPAGVVGIGSLNPNTGISTTQFRIAVKIDGFSNDCYIGTPGSPIVLNLTTETSGTQTGVRYNIGDGRLTIVDGTFAVPGASSCEYLFVSVNGQINDALHIPSPSGNNYARLQAKSTPIAIPGVRPSFTATPSSGLAPLNVNFNASATQSQSAVALYRWDFTNDGIIDASGPSPLTSFNYVLPGTYTAKLTVRDVDNDENSTTRTIVVGTPRPDIATTLSHAPDPVITGNQATFTAGATNNGTLASSAPTTAAFALPAGWTVDAGSGSGWTCDAPAGATISCSYAASLAIGETAPSLTITATPTVSGFYTATITAATTGDINASNDTATTDVTVVQAGTDLRVAKTHDIDVGLFRGVNTTYAIAVSNGGTAATTDRTRIVDTLPAGVTFVGASGGSQWTCSFVSGQVRCFTDEVIDPGETLTPVRIVVKVDADAPDLVINSATVTTAGESDTSNDTGSDIGNVQSYAVDYQLTKDAVGGGAPQGGTTRFTLAVKNIGFGIGNNIVTVTDTLPAGLTFGSATGDGWTCASVDAQVVTCTHEGNVHAGNSLPAITVTANVGADATGTLTNTAVVASDDDFVGTNDQDTADVTVRPPLGDLVITKSHPGASFTVGQNVTYTLGVRNIGAEPTLGTITVTDELPAGLQAISIGGTGWSCVLATLTCTRSEVVAPSAALPDITLVAKTTAAGTLKNVGKVANERDANGANNRVEDPTLVVAPAAPTSLEAYGVILHIKGLLITTGIINGPEARLTSNGAPVVNRELVFRTPAGAELCRARTDATGNARCGTVLIPAVQAILGLGYRVTFAGDPQYQPSSASGQIIKIVTSLL